MKLLQAFALAWNMLTIIPFLQVHNFYKGINALSVMFYPVVGFFLGLFLYGLSLVLEPLFPHMFLHVGIFFLLVVLTGALHLDGLSDTIDGLFVPKQKALQVMKDSHVGGMGMVFSGAFLIFKAVGFATLESLYLLPLLLALSRMGAIVAIYNFPYISSGVGMLIKEEIKKLHVNVALLFGFALSLYYGVVWAFIAVILYVLIVSQMFRRRYGGLSGDIYGFLIETSELLLIVMCIAAGL